MQGESSSSDMSELERCEELCSAAPSEGGLPSSFPAVRNSAESQGWEWVCVAVAEVIGAGSISEPLKPDVSIPSALALC